MLGTHSTGASFAHICSCLAAASPRRRNQSAQARVCPCCCVGCIYNTDTHRESRRWRAEVGNRTVCWRFAFLGGTSFVSSAVVVVNWGRTLRVVPAIQLRREKVMAHLKSKWRSLFSSGRADRVTASAEVSRLSKVGQFLFFFVVCWLRFARLSIGLLCSFLARLSRQLDVVSISTFIRLCPLHFLVIPHWIYRSAWLTVLLDSPRTRFALDNCHKNRMLPFSFRDSRNVLDLRRRRDLCRWPVALSSTASPSYRFPFAKSSSSSSLQCSLCVLSVLLPTGGERRRRRFIPVCFALDVESRELITPLCLNGYFSCTPTTLCANLKNLSRSKRSYRDPARLIFQHDQRARALPASISLKSLVRFLFKMELLFNRHLFLKDKANY